MKSKIQWSGVAIYSKFRLPISKILIAVNPKIPSKRIKMFVFSDWYNLPETEPSNIVLEKPVDGITIKYENKYKKGRTKNPKYVSTSASRPKIAPNSYLPRN
jgi:hypothetical protein